MGPDDDRTDTPAELELVRQSALEASADAAVVSNHWAKGGAGARALAEALIEVCERGDSQFKLLYDSEASIEEKITIISREIYGADGIELSDLARKQLETYTKQGFSNLPSEYSPPNQLGKRPSLLPAESRADRLFRHQYAWPRPNTRSPMTPNSRACRQVRRDFI